MALDAQRPNTVSITASNYRYSIILHSNINSDKQLVISGEIVYQRCMIDEAGNYTDDPSPDSRRIFQMNNINEFAANNPDLATIIGETWTNFNTLADQINASRQLV